MPEIESREDLICKSTMSYYETHEEEFKKLVDIIEKRTSLSISLIEYFTLTYSKIYNIMYKKSDDDFFIVYPKYKNFLKGYGKKFTDPFRRKQSKNEKDFYVKMYDLELKTRIAQLHFFKWAFENELITYIENNLEKIEKDMLEHKKIKTDKRKKTTSVQMFSVIQEVRF